MHSVLRKFLSSVAQLVMRVITNPNVAEQKGKDREPVDQQHHPPPATSPAPSQHPRDPKMQAARVRLPVGVYKEFEVNVSCLDGRKS
uniref:Uncharacterized protein n=1 Tax=Caenorhabditis japonica TaxID=281687 RepID=A0A8R1IW44_CAEJA